MQGPATAQAKGGEVRRRRTQAGLIAGAFALVGCVSGQSLPPAPPASALPSVEYQIGPGDSLNIFVWRNPELSANVPVRPDGRVSIPLVEDVVAVGTTSAALGREFEKRLGKYITDPIVTVMPTRFVGPFSEQVRVIGEAATPRALPYRANMTVLDAMIEVGGLTKYAAGDRATLVRPVNNVQESYSVYLDSLIKDGDVRRNVALLPGDVIIIPQTYY